MIRCMNFISRLYQTTYKCRLSELSSKQAIYLFGFYIRAHCLGSHNSLMLSSSVVGCSLFYALRVWQLTCIPTYSYMATNTCFVQYFVAAVAVVVDICQMFRQITMNVLWMSHKYCIRSVNDALKKQFDIMTRLYSVLVLNIDSISNNQLEFIYYLL